VTGGAGGIGHGMAQNFLKQGMKVVIVDFNTDYLDELRATVTSKSGGAPWSPSAEQRRSRTDTDHRVVPTAIDRTLPYDFKSVM
jgi:NAD(P)-dependent dehydrogenase (short-subunit alcohol dehydrogenase family)